MAKKQPSGKPGNGEDPKKRKIGNSFKSWLKERDGVKDARRQRVEHHLLRGVTSVNTISSSLNSPYHTIAGDIKFIRAKWAEERAEESKDARHARIRQLEHLIQTAYAAFDRSRQDEMEYSLQKKSCESCGGQGYKKLSIPKEDIITCPMCKGDREEEYLPNKYRICSTCGGRGDVKYIQDKLPCPTCGAKGHVTVEVKRVKGKSGDSSFLRIVKDAIVECCRLEGLVVPTSNTLHMRKMIEESHNVDGSTVRKEIQLMIGTEEDADLIIQSMVLIDRIEGRIQNGQIQKVIDDRIIDVTPEKE